MLGFWSRFRGWLVGLFRHDERSKGSRQCADCLLGRFTGKAGISAPSSHNGDGRGLGFSLSRGCGATGIANSGVKETCVDVCVNV